MNTNTIAIATLSTNIALSRPPTSMPGYYRRWRAWWRVALGVMRQHGIRDRAARDAIHERLLSQDQAAAMRMSERGGT